MFTVGERDHLQEQLFARAAADSAITGAALTGSNGAGEGDRWSDIDLVLAVHGEFGPVMNRWTRWLYDELGAVHHWDLPSGSRHIRAFLLPGWLEIDLTFTPEEKFGPRGRQWQAIFGQARPVAPFPAPDPDTLAGRIWHQARHAHASIERGRWWQAEHWISEMRNHVITLACLRLGYPAVHAKGAHLLPRRLATTLETTLARSLSEAELRRALAAAISVAVSELRHWDPALTARLQPLFAELQGPRKAG